MTRYDYRPPKPPRRETHPIGSRYGWHDDALSLQLGPVRDRLSGREMVAVAQSDTHPSTEDLPGAPLGQPIDPNDLRPGDEFEARERARVDAKGGWTYTGPTYYLLVRPDPDAALHAAFEAAWEGSESFDAPAFVDALRAAGYVIEPGAKAAS